MPYLMKAAEVWQPDLSGRTLVLGSAHFSGQDDEGLQAFGCASRSMQFGIDEGLPGITWAVRRPMIWTDLNTGLFKRHALAESAGLDCGLSIPVFAGEFLLAVVVLFFTADAETSGAVEVWRNRDYYDKELSLSDGFYGHLSELDTVSRGLSIGYGRGLPGAAWLKESPMIMNDLAKSESFLRSRDVAGNGISTGLAIPFFYTHRDIQVVTLLSAANTSVARRFEVWCPDESHRYLLFSDGYCAEGGDLKAEHRGIGYARGESVIGEVWLTGLPQAGPLEQPGGTGFICIPFVIDGVLKAVVRFEF